MKLTMRDLFVITVFVVLCWSPATCKKKKKVTLTWRQDSAPYINSAVVAKTEGSEVKLNCGVRGRPKPEITWYKNGQLFDPVARKKTRLHRFTLILNLVKTQDSGSYTCVVNNSHSSLNFTFSVDIIRVSRELIVDPPSNVTVHEGETATFTCRAINASEASTQWVRQSNNSQDAITNAGNNPKMLSEGVGNEVLVIHNVTMSDAGKYTCWIGTYYTIVDRHAWLTVIPKTTTTTTTTTTTPMPTTTTTTTTPAPTTTATTTPMPTTRPATTMMIVDATFFGQDNERLKPRRRNKEKSRKKKKNKKDRNRDRMGKKNKKNKNRRKFEKEQKKWEVEQRRNREREQGRVINSNNELETRNPYGNYYIPEIDYHGMDGLDQADIVSDLNGLPLSPEPEHNTQSPFYNGGFGVISNDDERADDGRDMNFGHIDNSNIDVNEGRSGTQEQPASSDEAEVSVWTIYIIVGSVAGGVLLVGLVAIIVAVCCNRIEDSGYKSTSV